MKMMKLKMIIAIVLVGVGLFSCSSDNNGNPVDTACEDATQVTLSAALAYNNATDAEIPAKCVDYKAALENQIGVCGDDSGTLQLILNGLGDCSVTTTNPTISGSITVTVGSSPRTFDTNISITSSATTQLIYAEDSAGYYIEFELVAVGATGTSVLQNFNIHLISKDYTPLAVEDGGNFSSNITINSDIKIKGVFSGYVTSSDNATLELTSGVINLDKVF